MEDGETGWAVRTGGGGKLEGRQGGGNDDRGDRRGVQGGQARL